MFAKLNNPRMGNTIMNKKIAAVMAFGTLGLFAGNASAGCVWVSCPNSAPPQVQYQQNYYQPQTRTIIEESRVYDNNSYSDNYSDNVRAGHSTSQKAAAHSSRRRTVHVSRSTGLGSGKSRSSIHKSTGNSSHRSVAARPAQRRVVARHTSYSRVTNNAPRRTNYAYSANNSRTYQNTYVQPIHDNARVYNAPAYGRSVNIAQFGGRGESWVSTRGQIVRYSTPHVISNVGGRSCGWGTQIAPNGQMTSNQAYVCHCATGWLPQNGY